MIGIVILNYMTWDETTECVESIFKYEVKCDYHIYIVDNASPISPTEKIIELVKDSRISLIEKKINDGYSAGNNVGIKQAQENGCCEILIVNSDVLFKKDSIYSLYKYLKENPHVGIVGPKIYLPDGNLQMINMGIRTGLKEKYMYLLRKTIFHRLVKKFINEFCAIDKDLTKPFKVHSVLGCCFLMSQECAEVITPLDENTFLYQEELIIGIRMEEKGYSTVYLTDSQVIHMQGQSTKRLKAFSFICLVESEMYYFRKYIKASILSLIPLYGIRTLQYLIYSIFDKTFRRELRIYFKKTLKYIQYID